MEWALFETCADLSQRRSEWLPCNGIGRARRRGVDVGGHKQPITAGADIRRFEHQGTAERPSER